MVATDGLRVGDHAVLQRLDHRPHARPAGSAGRGSAQATSSRRLASGGFAASRAADEPRHGQRPASAATCRSSAGRPPADPSKAGSPTARPLGQRATGAAQRSAGQQRDPDPGHRSQPADHDHRPRESCEDRNICRVMARTAPCTVASAALLTTSRWAARPTRPRSSRSSDQPAASATSAQPGGEQRDDRRRPRQESRRRLRLVAVARHPTP